MNLSLLSLAERAGSHPFFLAHHLAQLRHQHGQSVAEQAQAFRLDLDRWGELALCRMPACALDVADMAATLGVDPESLREMLQLNLWGEKKTPAAPLAP